METKTGYCIFLTAIVIASSIIHLGAFLLEKVSPDMETWLIAARAVAAGEDFYKATAPPAWHLPYWYPPLWAMVLGAIALFVSPHSAPVLYLLSVRILLMIGNFAVGLTLLKLCKGRLVCFALWMLNPLVIGVAQSGQFDILPTFLVLVAYLCHRANKCALTGFFIGLGFSFKIWPVFLLPSFITDYKECEMKRALILIGSTLGISIAVSLPFALTTSYVKNVLSTAEGDGGLFVTVMVAVAIVSTLVYWRNVQSILSIPLIIASLLVIMPNHAQYSIWILPFLMLGIVAYTSIPLALMTTAIWVLQTLQRYANTILKWTTLNVTVPEILFEGLFLLTVIICLITSELSGEQRLSELSPEVEHQNLTKKY